MKKIFLLLSALAGTAPAFSQSQLSTGAQGLTIKSGTDFTAGDLILQPNADFSLTNTSLRVSDTAIQVTNGSSIKKVFKFDPAVTFSGKVGIRYKVSELNGNDEDSLAISLFNGQILYAKPSEAGESGSFIVYSDPMSNVVMNNVTLGEPIPGIITKAGTVSAMSTTYGTASTAQQFTVSGTDIMSGITVTAPAGFEVSLDGTSFHASVTVTGDGTITATTVYVRIKSTTDVSAPSGYVQLSSPNSVEAPVDSVSIPASSILAKGLTVTGLTITSKEYNGNDTAAATTAGTLAGIVNSDVVTLNTASAAYIFNNKHVGNNKSVTVTGYTLSGADKDNYTLSQPSSVTGSITKKAAVVMVFPRGKCFAETINGIGDTTSSHFMATGFIGSEGLASVDMASTGFPAFTPAGPYMITASNAIGKINTDTADYLVSYTPGPLTVQSSPNAAITTAANVQLCAGNSGSIAINTTGTAPFTGRLRILNQLTNVSDTVNVTINNSGFSSPLIPSSYLANTGISPLNYKISWASLKENGGSCMAADNQLTGEVIITVFPVPNIDGTGSVASICNGSQVNVNATNPNAVGGTYNVMAQYNGVLGGTVPVNGLTGRAYTAGAIQETLSLNNSVTSPVTVKYIFTPVTTNSTYACVGINDTVSVVVNPKPRFDFAVNGTPLAANGTDTICQAASTTFALIEATNGHTFTVKHTWVDGNDSTHVNNNYASATIADGGFSNTFISGGNSVAPAVNPANEPTAGTYEITVSNPAFSGCTTTKTFHIYVEPKPEFAFAVNGDVVAIGGTDTICQAAPTTLAITGATNGHTFTVEHRWVDGNDSTHVTEYGAGEITNGGFSTSFISGGNSVNPAVNPGNEPTAGAYKITMTNPATGCVTTRTFNIYVQPKPEFNFSVNGDVVNINGTDTICQAAATTFAIGNATNGHTFVVKHTWVDGNDSTHINANYASAAIVNGGFEASFVSGGNSVEPSVNPANEPTAGAYEITMTNPVTNCTTTRTFNVYVQPKPEFAFEVNGDVVAIDGTDTICQAAPTTFAITNATNGHIFAVKHTWVDGNDSTHVNVEYAGGTITNGGFEGPEFTSGGNSVNPSVNPTNEPTAGAYEIKMTNPVTGCVTTRTFNIYVQPKPEFAFAVNGDVVAINGTDTICQATSTTFAITGATNGHEFTVKHMWVDGASTPHTSSYGSGVVANGGYSNTFISGGNSVNLAVNPGNEPTAGAYEITMTNPVTGCTTTRTFNVYVQPKPEFAFEVNGEAVAINGTDTICQAAPTTFAITNATDGHTFVVKHTWVDGNDSTHVNANYASATIVEGGFEGPEFTSGGNSVNPAVNPANEPTAGAYEITMTNPITGCITTRTFNIYVNPKPVDLFKVDGVVLNNNEEVTRCAGTAIVLTLEGDSTHSYVLSKELTGFQPSYTPIGAGQVNDPAYTFNADPEDAGQYLLVLTDDNTGCTKALNYSLVVNQSPSFSAAPGNIVKGNDTNNCSAVVFYDAEASGSGSTTYKHQFTGATATTGFEAGTGSGAVFNKGVTTVTIRAANGLCADKDTTFTVTVNDTQAPSITYNGGNTLSGTTNHTGCTYTLATTAPVINDNCGAGGLTLTYALTGASVTSGNGNLGSYNFNVGTTTVTYTVKDSADNQNTVSYTVTVGSSAPTVTLGQITAAGCYGSNTGTFTFSYNNGVGGMTTVKIKDVATGNTIYTSNNPISIFTGTQSNLYAGTYILSATNIHGCTKSDTVVIGQPAAPLALGTSGLTSTNVICGTPNSGTLTFGAQGGTAPYTVVVTGPNMSQTPNSNFIAGVTFDGYQLTGLGAGTYNVSVTDAHLCNLTQSVTIVANAASITASVSAPGVPSCIGDAAPNVTFTATGGTAPYTFSYTKNNTPYTVTTTGSATSVTVSQATTATGTFAYALTGVTDANGNPCASSFTQSTASVVVNNCGGPDLIPVVLMPAASFSAANTSRSLTINLGNIGNGATESLISLSVLKPTPGFTYTPNLPNGWSVVDNGYTLTFTSTNVIAPGTAVTLSGTLNRATGSNAPGIYTMTTFVNNGSGGESNTVNNVKFTTITMNP